MCPYNISPMRKWAIIITICTGTMCVTCASSIYTTTYTQMNAELMISSIISTLGLSFFVLGIAFGPILTSPLSEWYGRRPIYVVSWLLFMIWTAATAVARNIQTIIISRFFTGFAGGTFLSVSGGTAGDVFRCDEIQKPMTFVSASPFIGPCLGPLVGGFIVSHAHWRWCHYSILIWSAIILLSILFLVPETYHPIKLKTKAKLLRKETGNENLTVSVEKPQTTRARALAFSLLRPVQLLTLEPMCLLLDLYSAMLLGLLYLFFQAFPFVFESTYDFNVWKVGLTFLGIISGMILAATSTPLWNRIADQLSGRQTDNRCEKPPEYRLIPAIPGGVMIPVGLLWFGWSLYPDVHWIVPIIGSAIFGCGTLLAFTGIFTFLVDAYPKYAASALASNGLARCSFAAVFPLFGIQMYERLGRHWATTLLAFLTVLMMPLPLLFFKYGQFLRQKSRFALKT
ncbi:MFS general substrate transporter [Aspergillus steynii IBT 23096]|uniref:MFS general substrate transporter n=1 Tax=Aspergillus steynii IBT 23096 TaxID=1392250 RepID=A0A2I2GM95_9EURO|nr:MFS general substrate transporter [Aspergillus steynii IBT 23096]PLB54003.1 MFS general substrate transporter [Aspergillus steynii IBT 23096]